MRAPHVDDLIRLNQDIPELALLRGDVGIVRSTWFAPSTAYEVEFSQSGESYCTRTLLDISQLRLADDRAEQSPPIELHG